MKKKTLPINYQKLYRKLECLNLHKAWKLVKIYNKTGQSEYVLCVNNYELKYDLSFIQHILHLLAFLDHLFIGLDQSQH